MGNRLYEYRKVSVVNPDAKAGSIEARPPYVDHGTAIPTPDRFRSKEIADPKSPCVGTGRHRRFGHGQAGRWISAEEVASAVRYLASDDASSITGSNVTIDCGLSASLY